MKRLSIYILLGTILACSSHLMAQLEVNIQLDSTNLLIGDQLGVNVDFSVPAGSAIREIRYDQWANAGKVELLEVGQLNTVSEGPPKLLQQRLLLTTFASGYHYFPPLEVIYLNNGSTDTARTSDLAMTVATIPVSRESSILDNKDIIEEQINLMDILPYILGLILIVIIVLFVRRLTKKTIVQKQAPPPPPPPAHEVALQRLSQLEAKELWQKGEIKAYQSELTYVLRAYLEDRFSLQALEATTAEICQDFKKHGLDEDGRMRTVMETADMVKFAKAMPPQNVHAEALDSVRHFVEETRAPEPSPTESTEENEAAV